LARIYLLFHSTHETLKAESVLKAAQQTCKVVMKPTGIRSDCGLAVRVEEAARDSSLAALKQAGVEPRSVHVL